MVTYGVLINVWIVLSTRFFEIKGAVVVKEFQRC